jgi:hypothetical protein
LSTAPESSETLELPYRWGEVEGRVQVEVAPNRDPAALGCAEFARGFPYCRAVVEPGEVGYQHLRGWLQMVNASGRRGFEADHYPSLDDVPHPFCFLGYAPVFFDGPHTDEQDLDFLAHTFLCALGGELFEFRREARALLGFGWSFSKRGPRIEWSGPTALAPGDWDSHRADLGKAYPRWSFAAGFSRGPLGP